jgi:hypothetical protein
MSHAPARSLTPARLGRPRTTLLAIGAVVALAAAGCTSSAAAAPTQAPRATAAPSTEAAPASAAPMMGGFHGVDGTAAGTVELKKLGDGYVVVFEDFSIASADHTDVVLVENKDVANTTDVDKAMILSLGALKGTSGMQDYPVPAAMSGGIMGYHTVVLWDSAMGRAIAAAPLGL